MKDKIKPSTCPEHGVGPANRPRAGRGRRARPQSGRLPASRARSPGHLPPPPRLTSAPKGRGPRLRAPGALRSPRLGLGAEPLDPRDRGWRGSCTSPAEPGRLEAAAAAAERRHRCQAPVRSEAAARGARLPARSRGAGSGAGPARVIQLGWPMNAALGGARANRERGGL